MKRGEWHAGARLVHARHPEMTHAEIGALFGVHSSAVTKVLNPDLAQQWSRADNDRRRDAKTAWQRSRDRDPEVRGRCSNEVCGALLGIGHSKRPKMCQGCVSAIADVRRTLAEGMWADGWTTGEMCATYGVQKSYFSAHRVRGWDMPHRRTPEQVARIRAGRWEREELMAA